MLDWLVTNHAARPRAHQHKEQAVSTARIKTCFPSEFWLRAGQPSKLAQEEILAIINELTGKAGTRWQSGSAGD